MGEISCMHCGASMHACGGAELSGCERCGATWLGANVWEALRRAELDPIVKDFLRRFEKPVGTELPAEDAPYREATGRPASCPMCGAALVPEGEHRRCPDGHGVFFLHGEALPWAKDEVRKARVEIKRAQNAMAEPKGENVGWALLKSLALIVVIIACIFIFAVGACFMAA